MNRKAIKNLLPPMELKIVNLIEKDDSLIPARLAERLEVSPATIKLHVDRLVDKGVIRRKWELSI